MQVLSTGSEIKARRAELASTIEALHSESTAIEATPCSPPSRPQLAPTHGGDGLGDEKLLTEVEARCAAVHLLRTKGMIERHSAWSS